MIQGAGEIEADLIAPAPQPLAEMAEAGNIQVSAGFGIDNEAKGFHSKVLTIYNKEVYIKFFLFICYRSQGWKNVNNHSIW